MSGPATQWVVPDGWMPPPGSGSVPGHEAVCLVNLGSRDADVTLTVLFEQAEPVVIPGLACAARRTRHIRLDVPAELNGFDFPVETPYALVIDATEPVYVQHTRVDTRDPALALMTSIPIRGAGSGASS